MALRKYYFRSADGSLFGPVNLNTVAEMIQTGKAKANTPISLDGAEFKPMKSLPELATLLSVDVYQPDAGDADDILDAPPTYTGDLTQVSLPKLMYHFGASRASGRLSLSGESARKEVFLVNGKPVAVRSDLDRERLSRYLIRSGVLDELIAEKVLAHLGGDEERLGDYLIKRRAIKPNQLFEHLKRQMLEKLYEVFRWRTGTYAFYDDQEYKGTLLPLNLNPWEVIAEGVRSGYDLEELRELLDPLRNRILVLRDNTHVHVSRLELRPSEHKVFKAVSASWTLGGILDRLGGGDQGEKRVLSMVYMGIELELIGIGEELAVAPVAGTGGANASEEWDAMLGDSPSEPQEAREPELAPVQASSPKSPREQELLAVLNGLKEKNFFERLGLDASASPAAASKAFMMTARAFHPDHVPADATDRERKLASQVFSLLNDAHQTLSNDAKRAEYAEAIEAGFEDGQVDVANIMQAELLFQKGEVLLNSGRYAQALAVFQEAIDLNPDEGEFYICRGYASFFSSSNPDSAFRDRCIQDILRGLKMRDNNVANGFLLLGRVYKAVGDREKAAQNFRKALFLEKDHVQASRELRLLDMRSKKKGFWKKK